MILKEGHTFHCGTGSESICVMCNLLLACRSGISVWGVGIRSLACWDCGFQSHRGHGCLSVVSVVCCQVEVSATHWSRVQRSPTDCEAYLCVIRKPQEWGGRGPLWAAAPRGRDILLFFKSFISPLSVLFYQSSSFIIVLILALL